MGLKLRGTQARVEEGLEDTALVVAALFRTSASAMVVCLCNRNDAFRDQDRS